MERRTLLKQLLNALIVAPLGWLGLQALVPSLSTPRRLSKVEVGKSDVLFSNSDYVVTEVGQTPAIVFRRGDQIEAFSLECTHAKCTLKYEEQKAEFVCPCHGGSFHRDGTVKTEPPRKPLQRLFVSQHDGIVYLSDRVIG